MGAVVGHAGHKQLRAIVLDHHMLVHQATQAHALKFLHPRCGPRIILMVARDDISAMSRHKSGQRCGMRGKLGNAAIDHVARDGDQVGSQTVHTVDNRRNIVTLDGRPDMDIADLNNREARKWRWQTRERNVDAHDACHPARIDETDQSQQCRAQKNGFCRQSSDRRQPHQQQQQVSQQCQHQNGRKQAHAQRTHPTDPVGQCRS